MPPGEPDAPPSGVLLPARHFPGAAEVYLLAVDPGRHRAGVGFQPLEEIHGLWPGSPCLIMIKYLSPGRPGPGAPR